MIGLKKKFFHMNKQYYESAKVDFANTADSWLCAYALTYNYIVVTQEVYSPNIKNRIKIPNICEEFNIRYIDLFQFLKCIGIRLI